MECIEYRPVNEEGDEERASDFDWNGNVDLVLRKVPFRFLEESIVLDMPLIGCFRCTQCFDLVEDQEV